MTTFSRQICCFLHKNLINQDPDESLPLCLSGVCLCLSLTLSLSHTHTHTHTLTNTHTHMHTHKLPKACFRDSNVHSSSTRNSVTLGARFSAHVCCLSVCLCFVLLCMHMRVSESFLPLAESFLVLMILAAYSCPEEIFTHLLTTENAPLKWTDTHAHTERN